MSLDDLFSKVRMYAVDDHQNDDLKIWFNEFFKYFQKSPDEVVDEAKKKHKELRTKWMALLDKESETARKWRMDVGELKAEVRAFVKRISDDMCLNRVPEVLARLGRVIESAAWSRGQGTVFFLFLQNRIGHRTHPRNTTDVHINTSKTSSHTAIRALTDIRVQAM
jgi:hypothetical protein